MLNEQNHLPIFYKGQALPAFAHPVPPSLVHSLYDHTRGKGFKIQQGMILAPAGPRHPRHLDTWSILLGVGESTAGRGRVHLRPSALLPPMRTSVGNGLCLASPAWVQS